MRYSFYIINFSYVTYFNFHNVIVIFQDLIYGTTTIAVASFRAILDQVLKKVGFNLHGWRAILHQRFEVSSKTHLLYRKISLTLHCLIFIVLNMSTIGKQRRVHSSVPQLILMKFQAGRLEILTIFHIYKSGPEQHEICNMHRCTSTLILWI